MAITNAQQYQQLVNKPADGKRPGYRGPGKYQSGKSDKKEKGISPGRSQAQFGHAGHAGKTEDQAKSDQRLGNDRPSGSDPFAGHNQAEKKGFQKQAEINKQIQDGTFEPPKKSSSILDFFDKRKQAYNFARKLPGAAKSSYNNLVAYRNYLKSQGVDLTTIDRLMEGVDEETPIGFDPFQELAYGYEPKGITDTETLRGMFTDPTRGPFDKITAVPQNYSEFMLTQRNNPNLFAAGDLGNFMNMSKPKDLVNPLTGELYTNVEFENLKREIGQDRGLLGGGRDNENQQQTDPCLGPNPPAYCAVNNDPANPATPTRNLGGLAPRFAGSIFDFTGLADGGRAGAMDGGRMMMMANQEEDAPTGGIMDLESGRQMYFLGKLVKKASRAVKKIVKSPIGKAALMYFGGQALSGAGGSGIFSGLRGKLLGQAGSRVGQAFVPYKEGLLTKLGLTKGGGSFIPTLKGGISLGLGIPFALDALGVGKEEDDDSAYKKYMEEMSLDIPALRGRRNLAAAFDGSTYNYEDYADGGRIGYQEGSKEPVAKETMPLIDMDGKEMDLREEGGFVPLGRMERADDVPARLSKNEFVFTADAVRNAGEGDIDKGAEVMYNMMKNLESGGEVSEESQGLDGAREMFKTSQRLEEVL